MDSCTGQMELSGCQHIIENSCFSRKLKCHFKKLWQLKYDLNNICGADVFMKPLFLDHDLFAFQEWEYEGIYPAQYDRKFIFEIFKYGSEQMEGDGWSSTRQFGTDGQTEQWNKEDQKVKSRDLRSVAALQDTSVGWLGLLTLTVVSTCMGDCQEYQPVRKHHMLHTSVHDSTCDSSRPPSARYQSAHEGHHKV